MAQAPKTPFQCEKAFHAKVGRDRCFSQLPGANCAHPLIAEQAGPTKRGDHRAIRTSANESFDGTTLFQEYEWEAQKNVGICPYPEGAVYNVALLLSRGHCGVIHHQEICSDEADTHSYPEHTTKHGGSFEFRLIPQPPKSYYLVVKGYYLRPPWADR